MGCWGTGLYDSDDACELRDEFIDALRGGATPAAATKSAFESNAFMDGDLDEIDEYGAALHFALADTQWKRGCLQDVVKERVLALIESGGDVGAFEEGANRRRRTKVLAELKARLLSPQRPWKPLKPKPRPRPQPSWIADPPGTVFSVSLPDGKLALLKYVRDRDDIETRPTSVFRLLPWTGTAVPSARSLRRIGSSAVVFHGDYGNDFQEFSFFALDRRTNPYVELKPTGIVLEVGAAEGGSRLTIWGPESIARSLQEALVRHFAK